MSRGASPGRPRSRTLGSGRTASEVIGALRRRVAAAQPAFAATAPADDGEEAGGDKVVALDRFRKK